MSKGNDEQLYDMPVFHNWAVGMVDGSGRIVWVAGVAMAEECRVTAPGAGVVVLKLERRTL